MSSEKGYGPSVSPGRGRGMYSAPKNLAPVPKYGSGSNMKSNLQGPDAMRVHEMEKKQMRVEDGRGGVI